MPQVEHIPVRLRIKLQALALWVLLSLPSILVTLGLFFSPSSSSEEDTEEIPPEHHHQPQPSVSSVPESEVDRLPIGAESHLTHEGSLVYEEQEQYTCYENYTEYRPLYDNAQFWIEGILLFFVGLFGILGNVLALAVLRKGKNTKFNQLLVYMSVTDIVLIVFFTLMSSFTVLASEPVWFKLLFPYFLWPLGNIAITASVLMVVAVSTERFLAICRPLQYKPSPIFYVTLVMLISMAVNTGRFLEFELVLPIHNGSSDASGEYNFKQTELMADERYIVFSRYWNEIVVMGILPLLGLILLNYGIYTKIRKSNKFRKLHDKSHCSLNSSNRRQLESHATPRCQRPRPPVSRQPSAMYSGDQQLFPPNDLCSTGPPLSDNVIPSHGLSTTPIERRRSAGIHQNQQHPNHHHHHHQQQQQQQQQQLNNHHHRPHGSGSSASERSTKLLVGIVLVFLVCHVFRLVIQLDAVVHPSILGGRHNEYCLERGYFPSPVAVWILTSFNNFFLVFNSSINFVVYCLMGRSFRNTLVDMFRIRSTDSNAHLNRRRGPNITDNGDRKLGLTQLNQSGMMPLTPSGEQRNRAPYDHYPCHSPNSVSYPSCSPPLGDLDRTISVKQLVPHPICPSGQTSDV
ncbi:hypothetical protein TCAL_11824 [Tigriopus californicus]|uniref:G-protein coupled receptors family 1 profile domain-containing protein n=1 Tax=Tigriopus californicus TaxID=6832 RepID=A0A553P8C9_TIGCA|nr:uncharacterized protein LOC131878269 [Tigriopus californicus]TRY73942.1 hypothetical protein TCAL_11824 [Tigriopus californicus]|eukprot:TCALIF_11824-PA protein Name:"Similar to FR FMRFamide receptor (Drosophila melanogaster)" AED:0.31 eAED:0.31 QI:0/-1/0/1/-1/1/1/0/628